MPPKSNKKSEAETLRKAEEDFCKLIGGHNIPEPESSDLKLVMKTIKFMGNAISSEIKSLKDVTEELQEEMGEVKEDVQKIGDRLQQVEGAVGGGGIALKKKQRALAEAKRVVCFVGAIEGTDWRKGSKDIRGLIEKFGIDGQVRVLDVWETDFSKKNNKIMVRLDSSATADYLMKNKYRWDKQKEGREMNILPWISRPFMDRHTQMINFIKQVRKMAEDDKSTLKSYIYYGESDLELELQLEGMRGYEMVDPVDDPHTVYTDLQALIRRGTTRKRPDSEEEEEEVYTNPRVPVMMQLDGNLSTPSSSSDDERQINETSSRSVSLLPSRQEQVLMAPRPKPPRSNSFLRKNYSLNVNKAIEKKQQNLTIDPYTPDFRKQSNEDPTLFNCVIVQCDTVVYNEILKPMLLSLRDDKAKVIEIDTRWCKGDVTMVFDRDEREDQGHQTGYFYEFEMSPRGGGTVWECNIHCYNTKDKFMISGKLATPLWHAVIQPMLDNIINQHGQYLKAQKAVYSEALNRQASSTITDNRLCKSCGKGHMRAPHHHCRSCGARTHSGKCLVNGDCKICLGKKRDERREFFGTRKKALQAKQDQGEAGDRALGLEYVEDDAEAGEDDAVGGEDNAVAGEEEGVGQGAVGEAMGEKEPGGEEEYIRMVEELVREDNQPSRNQQLLLAPRTPRLSTEGLRHPVLDNSVLQTPAVGYVPPSNIPVGSTQRPAPVNVINRVRTGLSPESTRQQQQKIHKTPYPAPTDAAIRQQASRISMLEMEKERLTRTVKAQERVIAENIGKDYQTSSGGGKVVNNQTVKIVIEGKQYELQHGGTIKLMQEGDEIIPVREDEGDDEDSKDERRSEERGRRSRSKERGRKDKEKRDKPPVRQQTRSQL